jgi:transposase
MRMSQPIDLSQFLELPPEVVRAFAAQQAALEAARFEASVERAARQHEQAVVAEKEAFITELKAMIAAVEDRIAASEPDPEKRKPRAPRKARALPEGLPRALRVIEPDSVVCPCGCGTMVRIGADRTERLDYIPARYQVIVTVRPRYACPKGRAGVGRPRICWREAGRSRRCWRRLPSPGIPSTCR